MSDTKKLIIKRQYSRAGCIECKRRKIKCDELHPTCGNCARIKFECIYPRPNQRNRPRRPRKLTDGISKAENEAPISKLGGQFSPSPSSDNSLRMPTDNLDMVLFENVFDDANTLVHGLADFDILAMEQNPLTISSTSHSSPNGDNLKPFHSNIILNEPPKDNLFFNEEELKDYLQNGVDLNGNIELSKFWNQFNVFMSDQNEQPKKEMSNAELTREIIAKYKLSPEEQQYFEEIVLKRLVLYIYPFASTIEDNEVVHILLEYSMVFKYLVYALMALSALCLFTITKDRKHDHSQKKFTAVCMRLLVAAFGDLKNNEHSLWHIEGLIITVLLLTMLFSDMSFVDTTKVPISWISHLKEAKSLLVKYNSVKLQVQQSKPDTPGIVIAKLLFFCYDWISKLSMPVIEVSKEDLHDLWMLTGETSFLTQSSEYQRSLLKLGLLIPSSQTQSGFNLFMAMTSEVVAAVYKLLDVMLKINKKTEGGEIVQAEPEQLCELMAAIHLSLQQVIVPGLRAENDYLIDIVNPAHPMYGGPEVPISLPLAAYGKDSTNPLDIKYYSYCDILQLLHAYFLYLKLLTTPGLMYVPRSHPILRSMVDKIILLMFFVKLKKDPLYRPEIAIAESENFYLPEGLFDLRTIMIQLPFRMCIDLTDKDDDFEKLDLFFRGLIKLGSGNCAVACSRIKKNKEKARRRSLGKLANYNEFDYLPEGFPIY